MTSGGFQFSPGVFTVRDADPEQTLERFEQYVESMQMAFGLNRRINPTTGAKMDFDDRDKKDIIRLECVEKWLDSGEKLGKSFLMEYLETVI